MKKTFLIPLLAVAALAGCTQLSDKDRAMLQETHDLAQQAKDEAAQAAADAAAARADADKAAAKADKIFRQEQNK